MVPETPPTEAPPVALTVQYAQAPDGAFAENAEVADGRLLVRATAVDLPTGVPASDRTFRDVILDARLTLQAGGDDTVYGLYLRQTEGASYVSWGMSPTGRILVGVVTAGAWHTLTDAQLAPDLPFAAGVGGTNRFQVVAMGPALVFVLNGAIVTGINVDARYQEGYIGYWLLRGAEAPEAVVAVDWLQVRAVLPAQPV